MKRLIALTIGILITLPIVMGTALAADTTPAAKKPTPDTSICAKLNEKEQEGFYVILEEPIGGPDANYCFRVCNKAPEPGEKSVAKRICKILVKCTGDDKDLGKEVTCQRIQVIEAKSGMDLLNQYVRMIYLWAAGTIGIFAVLTIVISGVQIIATGASGQIDTAKQRITQALVGIVVLFLSGLILYTINPNFFV